MDVPSATVGGRKGRCAIGIHQDCTEDSDEHESTFASSPMKYNTCLLSLVLSSQKAEPIYRFFSSTGFLCVSTACTFVGVLVGTAAAIVEDNTDSAGSFERRSPDARFCVFAALIIPLYLQRLCMMDYQVLNELLKDFETFFVLINWLLVFPCLGRLLGLGFRLVYFVLLHLTALPSLLSDASQDSKAVFRNILFLSLSIAVMCTWIIFIEGEYIPNAFYDKPLLLREDRLAESVGPARAVLTTRLLLLTIFSMKYLFNSIIYPQHYVLLRTSKRRMDKEPFVTTLGLCSLYRRQMIY